MQVPRIGTVLRATDPNWSGTPKGYVYEDVTFSKTDFLSIRTEVWQS